MMCGTALSKWNSNSTANPMLTVSVKGMGPWGGDRVRLPQQLTFRIGPLQGSCVAVYRGYGQPPHCIQICLANQHDVCVIQSFRGEASFEVNHPTLFTLKMDGGMCTAHSVINVLHSPVVFIPAVPFLILDFPQRELPLAQAFVAFFVPCFPTC